MNDVGDPSTNVVDQSVDSSASTALTPEVNIDTATTEAAASTALGVSSSVPENTTTTEGSVSTTETAASTTLDASSSVPEQGKQATDNTKPAPVGEPFQPIDPKHDFPPAII